MSQMDNTLLPTITSFATLVGIVKAGDPLDHTTGTMVIMSHHNLILGASCEEVKASNAIETFLNWCTARNTVDVSSMHTLL